MTTNVEQQLRIIKKGAVSLIGEAELEEKIRKSLLTGKPLTVKFGMDPSAPDLHLGHAVILRKLKQMQDLGHNIVIVIGDFTAKIGDPTGKSKGRKALTEEQVLENAITYQEQVFHILDREKTVVRYNGEWLELLELGGTDQTFNILMGRTLQKERGQEPQAALFMPILEGTDGVEKMSKSLGNYIGIHEDAKVMFRKCMEVPDALIVKYFELATDILPEELDEIKEQLEMGCNPKEIKLLLAHTITSLYHNEQETEEAEQFFAEAFTRKEVPEKVDTLEVAVDSGTLFDCIRPLVQSGLIGSGAEFRRLVAQGGVQKNGEKAQTLEEKIETGDVLRIGKKKFVRLELL